MREAIQNIGGKKPKSTFRKWARNTTALGTAAGIFLATPYVLDATASHELSPLPDCPSYSAVAPQDPTQQQAITVEPLSNIQVAQSLYSEPEKKSSFILNGALNSMGDLTKMWLIDNSVQIKAEAVPRDEAQAYDESCADLREPLRDLRIFNPVLYDKSTYPQMKDDPANYLTFQNIAHFKDEASGNIMLAFYEPQSRVLSLQVVGIWHEEGDARMIAGVTENTDRVIPYAFAERFLTEVREQVRSRGLEVSGTSIFAHSMGASGGVLLKGLIETGHANRLVFGQNPKLTLVESFNESLAAQTISEKLGIPMDKLTHNTISARSGGEGTANYIAAEWDTNHPIGERVYSISANGADTHALPDIMIGLLNGNRKLTPYDGQFTASGMNAVTVNVGQFLGKLAKGGRDVREALGIG